MKDKIIPVYGEGFFHISLGGIIWYTIVFDYEDPLEEYWKLLRRGGALLEDESERLRFEMQKLMDVERIVINSEDVRATVIRAFPEVRGSPRRSTATFIIMIPFKPRPGVNIYENFYGESIAEYDYTVYWILECGEIQKIESHGNVWIDGPIAVIRVKKGTRIHGYESIVFNIPKECFRKTLSPQSF